jgi:3-dehydroquinate synthase
MAPDDFLRLMAVDKKNVDGKLRLVVLHALGDAVVTDEAEPQHLHGTLQAYCQGQP